MAHNKTRYLLFIGSLGSGGAERVFVNYANGLAAHGADVHLATLREGPYEADLSDKVTFYKVNRRLRYALMPLLRITRSVKPDVILSGLTGPNLLMTSIGIMAGVSHRWVSIHNDLSSKAAISKADFGWLLLPLIFISSLLATRVIAVSQGVKSFLVQRARVNPRKISVIYYPIDTKTIFFQSKDPPPDIIEKIKGDGSRYIVAAGRLVHQKGFDLLIRAYSFSCLSAKGIQLVIIGEGEQKDYLAKLAFECNVGKNVILLGFVNNPYSVYAHAEVLVMSSRWEGFGNVLVEALATETPVISYDCPSGPREIISGLPSCKLVPCGNIAALAEAMNSFASSVPDNDFYRAAEKKVKCFSPERVTEKLIYHKRVDRT